MDEIIDSRVHYEEANNQTISSKEWHEDDDLSQINLNPEANFEFNSFLKYHDDPIDQNANLKNAETCEKINTGPSSDPLTEIKSSLFSDVRYYTINCADPFIDQILENNGANKESYLTTFITHVIYDKNGEDPNSNADFCEAKEVFDLTIVTSDWFRSCLKCECLLPTKPFLASNENRLFTQIKAINVNMSENLAKEIHALLSYNGAELIDTETNDVETFNCQPTHAFSVNFDSRSEKLDSKLKLVTPDWVTDCIKQNTLLHEKKYHPKYLKSGESDKILEEAFKPIEIEGNKTYQEQTWDNSNSTKKFSKNLTLFTNNSDKQNYLQSHANNFICEQNTQIESTSELMNPGTNSSNSNTQNEQKSAYDTGLCVDVSTAHNESNGHRVTTPSKPKSTTPKKILTKKKNSPDTKASYSLNDSMNEIFDSVINKQASEEKDASENFGLNTNGLQPLQVDLIQPIQNSGKLNFDLDLDSEPVVANQNKSDNNKNNEINSNLLYGYVFYTKANEEIYPKDCFDDWENVILKFGGKLLNHISLDDSASVSQITHFICPNRFTKCFKKAVENGIKVATVYWLEDVLQEQVYRSPWLVYHFPSPYEHKAGPLRNHIFSSHGFTSKEKLFIFQVVWLLGGKYSSYLSNINSFLIAKNLKGPKVEKAKCWNIPIVNANWLMELYLGNTYALNKPIEERYKNIPTCDNYNHFAFDTSMVQDFMKHWKNDLPLGPPLAFKSNNSVNVKYSSKRSEFDEKVDQSPNKMKKVGLTWQQPQSNIPIVLFTGIESSRTAQFQRDVIGLGGIVAKQPRQATLLVVDKIDRTAKLLKCISTVENIVSIKWIIDSKLNGRFLDPSDYQVKDEWFENYYGCNLKDSLERAKRRPMFNGLVFYLSPSVRPSYQDLTDMINAAGGSVTNDIPTLPLIHEPFKDEFKTNLKSKYVIVGSQADLCILKPFIEKKIQIDLYNKKCEIINSLIELIELRTKYRFNFDCKFIRPEATNLQCTAPKAVMLSASLINEYFLKMDDFCDNFTLTRGLIDLIKSFLLNNLSNFIPNNEKIENDEICERDSYLVELVDELEEDELCRPNIENSFSESMSKNVLNDSFDLIKKYDTYAENLVNEIFNDFGKEIDHGSNNDSEIEIKIKLPSCLSFDHGYFQRRHSADIMGFNYKSEPANPTLPNIVEDCLGENDLFWRRHSLNNTSYKLNKPFNNTMPIIIVDFEEEFDGKWSSRSSLDKSRLSDSECELNNSQFKQYTKVTLKNILNKSPNSKKNKNELLQSRNEDLLKETAVKNSEFCKSAVGDIVTNSINTVQSIIKKKSELAQNLVESSVNDTLDEMRKIFQIRKINELYLKCDCVNMNHYCRKKDRIDCKLLIYLICSVLEEMNFTNSAIFECKNYQLMKKLSRH